jgi:hypothetical protein
MQNSPQCAKCGRFKPWSRYVAKLVFGSDYWNGPDEVDIGICERCEKQESEESNGTNQ